MYLRFPGSRKPSSSISYVLFSSEEKYFEVYKSPLKLASYTNPFYTLYSLVLSVFPSSSDASTHFHIETPSNDFINVPGKIAVSH